MKIIAAAVVLALATICFSVAALVSPTKAAECFLPWPAFLVTLKEMDGAVIATARYPGSYADMSVIYTAQGRVLLMSFQNGCAVTNGLTLDTVPETRPPPGTPA